MRESLYSVEDCASGEAIARLVAVCFPDAQSALDLTYGHGGFWTGSHGLRVTGVDIDRSLVGKALADKHGASVYEGDFRSLPTYGPGGWDIAVFDPPYQTDMGRGKASVMGGRFGTFDTITDLEAAVRAGVSTAWTLCRLGIIVKVQNYVHGSVFVHMTRWVYESVPVPVYDELHTRRLRKMHDPKWTDQLSVYRNHATYLVFRKGDQRHIRRGSQKRDKTAMAAVRPMAVRRH